MLGVPLSFVFHFLSFPFAIQSFSRLLSSLDPFLVLLVIVHWRAVSHIFSDYNMIWLLVVWLGDVMASEMNIVL